MKNYLEIYVHIPFCQSKCRYCDFLSWPERNQASVKNYFDALGREIAAYKKPKDRPVGTVYFGGGTPSAVDPRLIAQTAMALEEKFGFDFKDEKLEKTIEVNPKTVDEAQLKGYRELGFNRLSVGIQSLSAGLLKTLGRLHTAEEALAVLDMAEAAGFDNISADLMSGLPGQTLEDIDKAVARIAAYPSVRHISCYSLIIEPGTVFEKWQREGRLGLPSEKEERRMYHHLCRSLEARGFHQYEISNFARPGCASRHNSGYWDLTPYAGFGLGAASLSEQGPTDQDGAFFRRENTRDFETYLKNPSRSFEGHALPKREAEGDFMFLGLRTAAGVRDEDFIKIFGESFKSIYKKEISTLIKENLIKADGSRIFLTRKGLDLANQVFMAFV
ncbi:radical SAM family heme chaperone HemW [Pseudoramibacter sp.]|jgi:oxygen-independent coproporphyrinogen-3 oxidase|uniref:radical SAM family heme chaperone HemW n=1 Tax=Pseudoramibacter sp. TaxID=2034862 RepID=UPI0025D0244E|nr:radical SAM family heme chaperone HemW [Pseudoramibacter sp.]MCH4071546.1 radical SAM family heme chaperone HemW [Pseudoramibacter sp.]MCH4105314.1 radical SAM family heme chaperone HemW [Pseudoramibacter sp.]